MSMLVRVALFGLAAAAGATLFGLGISRVGMALRFALSPASPHRSTHFFHWLFFIGRCDNWPAVVWWRRRVRHGRAYSGAPRMERVSRATYTYPWGGVAVLLPRSW